MITDKAKIKNREYQSAGMERKQMYFTFGVMDFEKLVQYKDALREQVNEYVKGWQGKSVEAGRPFVEACGHGLVRLYIDIDIK